MSGVLKIKALNDALQSQNDMLEQYGARERADRETKVALFNNLARASQALNDAPSGVEIIPFPSMRSEDLAKMKPHEMTEAIARWCNVSASSLSENRKELGQLYEALGVADIDANLDRFNQLRTSANQSGIAANFRGLTTAKDIPIRPQTPEEVVDHSRAAGVGPVPIPSPPDSSNGEVGRKKQTEKPASAKTTTIENILGGSKTGRATPKKK